MAGTSSQENREQAGDIDRALHNLIDHVKVLSADTRELLSHTAEQSGEQLARMRSGILERGAAIGTRLLPLQRALVARGRHAASSSAQHVRRHPWSTVAATGALVLAVAAMIAWHCESEAQNNESVGDRG